MAYYPKILFDDDEVQALKDYYLMREKWYQLAILVCYVVAFFLGSVSF